MDTYRTYINRHFPDFFKSTISLPSYNIHVCPWEKFNKGQNPKWWSKHNKVKHERDKNYKYANLRNVIHSASGLLVVLAYYSGYGSYFPLERNITPKLFSIDGKLISGGVEWERPIINIPQSEMCNHNIRSEA